MRWYESDAADDPNDYVRHEYGGNKYRMQWRDDSAGTWFNALTADGTNRFVGIGTTTPSQELDVAGDINLTGGVYYDGRRFLYHLADDNTFVGREAGNLTMGGDWNTGIGYRALNWNTTGYDNTAVGWNALNHNTTGRRNTAVGGYSISSNYTGQYNTAVGYRSLNDSEVGEGNVAVGYRALDALDHATITHNNTAVGRDALGALHTGSLNIALGMDAGSALTNGISNVYISNPGVANESFTIRIGGVLQAAAYIEGIHGTTVASGTAVYIKSDGQLGTTTSSARFKTGIADLGSRSAVLYDLRPITFRYKPEIDPTGIPQYGLIAEEVAAVAPDLVINDEGGDPYTVRYEQLVPLLLNELQLKDAEIEELRTVVAEHDAAISDLSARLAAVERRDE